MPNQKDFDLTTKEGRQAYREALANEGLDLVMLSPLETSLRNRIKELEDAIILHSTKVQLIQVEDLELWSHVKEIKQ